MKNLNICESDGPKCAPIRLSIQGIGHVPSMKNSRVKAPNGIFTKPTYRKWMQACDASFALQLHCEFRMRENATPTGRSRQSWIASSLPLDDSVREIVEIHIKVEKVEPGQEGADILIEPV